MSTITSVSISPRQLHNANWTDSTSINSLQSDPAIANSAEGLHKSLTHHLVVGDFVRLAELSRGALSKEGAATAVEENNGHRKIGADVDLANLKGEKETKRGTRYAAPSAAPLDIFEGVVQSVDTEHGSMYVKLISKMRPLVDHFAEIRLEYVIPQDRNLVRSGAVFYLSLAVERRRGTVKNVQEIRFRRLPSWTRIEIQKMREDAKVLMSKLKPRPLVDD
ncbi:hypothetical protein [Burkholderia sola]